MPAVLPAPFNARLYYSNATPQRCCECASAMERSAVKAPGQGSPGAQ
jgi:hypothetical protein